MSDQINDLETVIEDSVNDVNVSETTTEVEAPVDNTPEVEAAPEATSQVETPANKEVPVEGQDDFATKFGIQANSVTGRENRIPYSRVKAIVAKNEKDTVARLTKEFEEKYKSYGDYETKVKDYEGRLERVAQFENILENDPRTFLTMLSQHPSYTAFFQHIEQLAAQGPTQQAQTQVDPNADMPQPDQQYPDGTMGYSMQQLQALLDWKEKKAVEKAISQVEERYKPIEQQWQAQERYAKMVPVVEKQIAEARTWDKFSELEDKIVGLLAADKSLSLERAYMRAYQEYMQSEVLPKYTTDRNTIRQEVLAEIKKKPTASASPTAPAKPNPFENSGISGGLEDVITAELRKAGHLK